MANKHKRLITLKRVIALNIHDGILNGDKIDAVEAWLDYFLAEAKGIEESEE